MSLSRFRPVFKEEFEELTLGPERKLLLTEEDEARWAAELLVVDIKVAWRQMGVYTRASGACSPPDMESNSSSSSSNSAFDRFLRKAQLVTGLGVTDDERAKDLEQLNIRRCEKMKKDLMETSKFFLVSQQIFAHFP